MPTHNPNLRRLSLSQLGEITGFAPKTVTDRLRAAGLEPVARDGRTLRYDPRPALRVLFAVGDPQAERARLDAARAEMVELQVQVKRGDLVPGVDVDRVAVALATLTSTRLQGIPSELALALASESTAAGCQRLVEDAIHAALHDLADTGRRSAERIGDIR